MGVCLKKFKNTGGFFVWQKIMLEKHPVLYFAVLSVLENFLIECLSRHSLIAGFRHLVSSPMIFLYNSLIIMLTLSFALLFRRRVFGVVLMSVPWIICGIVNCVVLSYRVTPLGAIDFQIVKISMLLIYLSRFQRILLYIGIVALLLSMVALWIIAPKIKGKMQYGKNVASIVGVGAAVVLMTFISQSIFSVGKDFGNIVGAYKNYGFVYCFSSSMLDTGIDEPLDYGEEKIAEILGELPQTTDTTDMVKPDVILIQLESFLDPKNIKDMTFSTEPVPVYSYLRKNFSSGYLEVPSFGGGTANTEFEVLTGINLDNFGAGEYPYKTIMMKSPCESLASNLKENGYSAHAIHNHTGGFYDRDKVYPNMGFDSFQSIEYMNGFETTPYGWCKDSILPEEIVKALELTDEEKGITTDTPKFIWTVSVQGHGAYPSEPIEGVPNPIKIESDRFTEEELCALEYYINQVGEMDVFLGTLIAMLETRERPTLLIAYGDHLPSIGIEDEDLLTENAYTTEYVTWNNFGLEKNDDKLRAYELSSEIMGWLGFNNGNITKLHQFKSQENSTLGEEEFQNHIKLLAYDMLYGEKMQFAPESQLLMSNMRMGTIPITISDVKVNNGNIYVRGEGFTAKSCVFVNGKKVETNVLSPQNLVVEDEILAVGDEIAVGQTNSKRNVLSYTNSIIYAE